MPGNRRGRKPPGIKARAITRREAELQRAVTAGRVPAPVIAPACLSPLPRYRPRDPQTPDDPREFTFLAEDRKKGTGPFCRNGPEGASSHKRVLSPFPTHTPSPTTRPTTGIASRPRTSPGNSPTWTKTRSGPSSDRHPPRPTQSRRGEGPCASQDLPHASRATSPAARGQTGKFPPKSGSKTGWGAPQRGGLAAPPLRYSP